MLHGGAYAAHMAHEWQCYCIWQGAWEPDYVSTVQAEYAQHTAHVRAAINMILVYGGRMYNTRAAYMLYL